MSKWINMPKDLVDKQPGLEPGARRLAVTCWCICDDSGFVSKDLVERAGVHWGERFTAPTRVAVKQILEDLQELGFIKAHRERADCWQIQRSGKWMN